MQKILLTVLLMLMAGAAAANAQSYRVTDLADRLSQQSDDFADRVYGNFTNRSSNTRSDVENVLFAQQLSSAANVFRRMVQDRRRESELRDAASLLADLSRRAPVYGTNAAAWREVQRTIDDLGRELRAGGGYNNGGYGGGNSGGNNFPDDGDVTGRVRWRGTVDDEVQLFIRDQTIEVRTISGSDFGAGTYNFTSSLPNARNFNVTVNKIKGRGEARVIQQPNRSNDFTAVVQIRDTSGGAKEYELDITWRR